MNKQHVAYFVSDLSVADFCCSEIRKMNDGINIAVYDGFDSYFNKICTFYSAVPYIDVAFQYYKLHELINQLVNRQNVLDIIIDQYITGVRIVFTPLNILSVFEDLNCPEIIRYYLRGRDLKLSSKNVYEKLYAQASLVYHLRLIYIKKRHLTLKEFLGQITRNLLLRFNGAFPELTLWEKKSGSELYKQCGDSSAWQGNGFGLSQTDILKDHVLQKEKIKVVNIAGISDKETRHRLQALTIKYHLLLFIHSTHVKGYLSFFSKLERIEEDELELLRLTVDHIALAIDNTYFFKKTIDEDCALSSIFRNSDDGIIVVGPDRKLLDLNEAAQQFTGWDKKEAIGKYCKDLYQSCMPNGTSMCNTPRCPMLCPLLEQKTVSVPRVFTHTKNGKQKIVKSKYLYERETDGDVVYGIAVVRDISQRVQMEQKLQGFERLAALGKFAAELTHEIRNPITGISSNAQFLFEESRISRKSRMTIAKEIMVGASMVEKTARQILCIANPGEPEFCLEDINFLIGEILSLLKKKIKDSGVTLRVSLSEDIPLIHVDGNLIKQVLLNILLNSMESMEEAGVMSVKSWLTPPRAFEDDIQQFLQVIICDTGCGISRDSLGRIFDPFFTTKKEGSGLGLYTSDKILKDHDASIAIKSKVGLGTQVFINFRIDHENMRENETDCFDC